jgi:hypothetical protein
MMARKLGIGAGMAWLACLVLAGCQAGSGSRFANNPTNSPAMAKQGALPGAYPAGKTASAGFPTPANQKQNQFPKQNDFSQAPASSFPGPTPGIAPVGGAPSGPALTSFPPPPSSGLGAPSSSNRPNTVTFTNPDVPLLPPASPAFADPGISPIQPGR